MRNGREGEGEGREGGEGEREGRRGDRRCGEGFRFDLFALDEEKEGKTGEGEAISGGGQT